MDELSSVPAPPRGRPAPSIDAATRRTPRARNHGALRSPRDDPAGSHRRSSRSWGQSGGRAMPGRPERSVADSRQMPTHLFASLRVRDFGSGVLGIGSCSASPSRMRPRRSGRLLSTVRYMSWSIRLVQAGAWCSCSSMTFPENWRRSPTEAGTAPPRDARRRLA
jgi:hypothetical protein